MLVNQRLGRISEQQFRDDEESHIFFAVKSLLKDVASVAVCSKFDNTSPGGGEGKFKQASRWRSARYLIQLTTFLRSSAEFAASRHR